MAVDIVVVLKDVVPGAAETPGAAVVHGTSMVVAMTIVVTGPVAGLLLLDPGAGAPVTILGF